MDATETANWAAAGLAIVAAVLWFVASVLSVKSKEPERSDRLPDDPIDLGLGVIHKGKEDIVYDGKILGASISLQGRFNAIAAIFAGLSAVAQATAAALTAMKH